MKSSKIILSTTVFLICIFFNLFILSPQVEASSSTANLWIDTNGGSCIRQASPGDYSDANACGSFNAALAAATRGDRVNVKAGTYGPQILNSVPAGGTGVVTFEEAPGEIVIIGDGTSHTCQGRSTSNYQLCIEDGSFFELIGFTLGASEQYGVEIANTEPSVLGSQHVTLRNIIGETFRIIGRVSDLNIIGGDFGNNNEGTKPQIKKYNPGDSNTSRPNNIVIQGVLLHDSICSDGSNCSTTDHTECLQLIHSQNVTISGNKFYHCEGTGALGVTDGPHSTLTIENNMIADLGSPYGCQITKNITNLLLQFNSFGEDCFFSDNDSGGPYTVRGNYGYYNPSLCTSGVSYSYNLLLGGNCGGIGDQTISELNWVNEATGDLHLTSTANALGKVLSSCISTDYDGSVRPSTGCDAGADEITSTPPPIGGGTSPTGSSPPSTNSGGPASAINPSEVVTVDKQQKTSEQFIPKETSNNASPNIPQIIQAVVAKKKSLRAIIIPVIILTAIAFFYANHRYRILEKSVRKLKNGQSYTPTFHN